MASLTQWTWVWGSSGSRWWIGKPGVLQSTGLPSWTWLSDWTELTEALCGQLKVTNMKAWGRKWQPSPVFLPGESHEWRSLVGYSPRGRKESDTTERLHSLTHRAIHKIRIKLYWICFYNCLNKSKNIFKLSFSLQRCKCKFHFRRNDVNEICFI